VDEPRTSEVGEVESETSVTVLESEASGEVPDVPSGETWEVAPPPSAIAPVLPDWPVVPVLEVVVEVIVVVVKLSPTVPEALSELSTALKT